MIVCVKELSGRYGGCTPSFVCGIILRFSKFEFAGLFHVMSSLPRGNMGAILRLRPSGVGFRLSPMNRNCREGAWGERVEDGRGEVYLETP